MGKIRVGVQKRQQNIASSMGKPSKIRITCFGSLISIIILFPGVKFCHEFKNGIRILLAQRESLQKHDLLVFAVSEGKECCL